MVQGQVPLAVAGGIDDPEHPIGTDPMKVLAAIESVYGEDGVLVLMDLGSALLSAEMALEFLPEDQQKNVKLCAAPLVEGTMAAAVQAMVGGTLAQVLAEAEGALAVKVEQLNLATPAVLNGAAEPQLAASTGKGRRSAWKFATKWDCMPVRRRILCRRPTASSRKFLCVRG